MFTIAIWIVYGLIVGILAKMLHPGDEPSGCLPTIITGVVGSYVGGFINYVLGYGGNPLSPSGIVMGVVGGVLALFIYKNYIETK